LKTTVNFALFAPVFHFQLRSFCWGRRKYTSCPRAQGTLATPLNIGMYNYMVQKALWN